MYVYRHLLSALSEVHTEWRGSHVWQTLAELVTGSHILTRPAVDVINASTAVRLYDPGFLKSTPGLKATSLWQFLLQLNNCHLLNS